MLSVHNATSGILSLAVASQYKTDMDKQGAVQGEEKAKWRPVQSFATKEEVIETLEPDSCQRYIVKGQLTTATGCTSNLI